jgi:hypothetical protein
MPGMFGSIINSIFPMGKYNLNLNIIDKYFFLFNKNQILAGGNGLSNYKKINDEILKDV